MKGPPENRDFQGLGRKIVTEKAEPEWKRHTDAHHGHIYKGKDGKLMNGQPVPDCPQQPTAIDVYLEAIAKRVDDLLNGASFDEAEQP